MKKMTILAMLCCLYSAAMAQSGKHKGFRIGLQGNAGAGQLIRSDIWTIGEMSPKISPLFGGGIEIGYRFNEHISLYTGIGINRYNFMIKLKPVADFRFMEWFQIYGHTTFWEVPLKFRYHILPGSTVGLYCDIGAKAGKLQSQFVEFHIDNNYDINLTAVKRKNIVEKSALSPLVGIGADISLGTNFGLSVEAELAYQVNNMFENDILMPVVIDDAIYQLGRIYKWEAYPLNGMLKAVFYLKL